jgi:Tfp pilus assembly protein PilF
MRNEPAVIKERSAAAGSTPFAQALQHYRQGRYPAARELLAAALQAEPNNPQLWHIAGNVAKALGDQDAAECSWRQSLTLDPTFAEAHYNLGVLLQETHRMEEAGACYQAALLRPAWHPRALNNLGTVHTKAGNSAEALRCFDQAVLLDPAYGTAHHNRGRTLVTLGRFKEACQAFESAIAHLPPSKHAQIYRNFASAKRFTRNDPSLQSMEALWRDKPTLSANDQMALNFALGKAYDDIGDHAQSFQHYRAGNREKRRQTHYDEAGTLTKLDRIRAAYSPELMAARAGASESSDVPVFIVGMPRSGSTLVEQILSSHPDIHGAGECEDFPQLVNVARQADGTPLLPIGIAGLPDAVLRELGRHYVQLMQARSPAARRVVDKNLINFQNVGLIHLALPSAKIIHTRRDPVDTCLSCFFNYFQGDFPYAYDLAELGRYWRAQNELMAHWHRVLPAGSILELRYEDVVGDQEGQTRRLLDHIGMDWNASCLNFHRNQRPIYTASARQVREPIYRSSVHRARAYDAFIEPLLNILAG